MSKKTVIFLFFLIASPVIIYFLWPTDENRIKKLIREGAGAVEKEDLDAVMSKVSLNYRDDYGLTYMTVRKLMGGQFDIMSGIKVEYEGLKIEVKDGSARAGMDVRVIATVEGQRGYYVGDLKEPVHFVLHLKKERTKWQVTKSEGLALKGMEGF